jgi:hypothetical protein
VLTLPFLGASRPVARIGGRPLLLSLRHAELLAALALHPEGRSADQLATAIHGDAANPLTIRAEVDRLRAAVGAGVLRAQPYRLHSTVDADFLEVRAALAAGRVRDAALAYRGPLLPRSEAPVVREERELLLTALRRAVLGAGDPDALWAFASGPDQTDDVEVIECLLRRLPDRDPRQPILAARLVAARRPT